MSDNWQNVARTNPDIQAWYQQERKKNPKLDPDVVVSMLHTPPEQYNYPLAINTGNKPTAQGWGVIGSGERNSGGMIPAMIQQESSYNKLAKSSEGALGLMQIMPIALEDYNKNWGTNHKHEDMVDPVLNRKVGTWYISERIPQLLNSYNIPVTPENMLWAYNGGIGNVHDRRMSSESKDYIKKVKSYMRSK